MNEIRDIHEPFIAWLKKFEIPYHRNRPDKKTTAVKGDPDFLVTWMSHCVYIECKIPGNGLSEDQEKRIAYIQRAGNKVVIAYSMEECIEACKNILCVGKERASDKPFTHLDCIGTEQGKVSVETAEPTANLFIGKITGTDYVLRGDGSPGGQCEMVRRATPADLLNLKLR